MLVLLDIDGTLTEPMGVISKEMIESLWHLKAAGHKVGIVGGSDRAKAMRQVGEVVLNEICDYAFHENGCVYYRKEKLIHTDLLEHFIGGGKIAELTTFILAVLAATECPWRTGTFVERRNCMLNISPIGRQCTQEQRKLFAEWDEMTGCRREVVRVIREAFPALPINLAIGGEISIDIVPTGMDKTRCLVHLHLEKDILFIGDRTEPGGNDHELFEHRRVMGHRTEGPKDTIRIIHELMM